MSMVMVKLANIQAEVEAIAKERNNDQQHYRFRGVEDVLNTIHALLAKHRVIVSTRLLPGGKAEERKTKSGGLLITRVYAYEFDFVAEDDSRFTAGPFPGEGMDSGDKASNKTVANAYKYCMFFTFSIPTKDLITEPDAESPEAGGDGKGTQKAEKPKAQKPKTDDSLENLRGEITAILNNPVFQTDEELRKEAAGAQTRLKSIKDKNSLQNFRNMWAKKLADQPITPEAAADAVQGELVSPDDAGTSEAFDQS